MGNILNTGMDLNIWFNVLKIFILIGFFGFIIWQGKGLQGNGYTRVFWLAVSIIIFILTFVFLYLAPGPGRELDAISYPAPIEQIKDLPEEKTKEEVQQEALNNKPEVLKRQDSSFLKEAQEADEYIKRALKNNEGINK